MKNVFLSYRQTGDGERQRVRQFAEQLRQSGINVILDQFLLEEKPEGPSEGWDKWSSDQALKTDFVIIIGSPSWFQCFDKTQPPGTGLGAACEADDLRTRIYDAAGIIDNIRVVLFDNDDASHISAKIKRYHRFHAVNDFAAIVRWLGGSLPATSGSAASAPKTAIPHNLPRLQSFFGRTEELAKIREALDPESRTWGALIDGPGGMGKTSLAVRAAYECTPEQFDRIVFISIKDRELDDDGVRTLGTLLIPGLLEMLNELARELGHPEIPKSAEDQRIRLLLDALRGTCMLLILDNLESLPKPERDQLFTFVKRLPAGCKAILTSRRRIGSSADTLILEKLDQDAALQTLADLAKHIPLLAKTSEAERIALYTWTDGNPLLLRWVAGQLGRGSCRTFTDALHFLRSCPPDNDPLEFIFGDLATEFTPDEEKVLCALTYFTLPAKLEHIHTVADPSQASDASTISPPEPLTLAATETALRTLANRSLVIPDEEEEAYALVPMVAEFLRKHRPKIVHETGTRLEERAYTLIMENGSDNHDRFPVLDAAWPTIAPALPVFLAGENVRLQEVCAALQFFLEFSGRWDERFSLIQQAEAKALSNADYMNAGRRAVETSYIHFLRREANGVVASADRAMNHWLTAEAGARERAIAIRSRARGYDLKGDYVAAVTATHEALELFRSVSAESRDVSVCLSYLATAKQYSGDYEGAAQDYRDALRVARALSDEEGMAGCTVNLAALALEQQNWVEAENLARQALPLSEKVRRLELIAANYHHLAKALLRQEKASTALPYAGRAVEIFAHLGSPHFARAYDLLRECLHDLAFHRFTPGWIYNTTTLEGSTLSLDEVTQVLSDPAAELPARPAADIAANRANESAKRWMLDFFKADKDWTKTDLFHLHTLLMQGSTVDIFKPVGAWKKEDNFTTVKVAGKPTLNNAYAPALYVHSLMDQWLTQLNRCRRGDGEDPFLDYLWLHAAFARIHPFADGNGRMARLLANLPLLAAGLHPVDIPATTRDRYLESLARWQIACGPPAPGGVLYDKPELLDDFTALCRESHPSDPSP